MTWTGTVDVKLKLLIREHEALTAQMAKAAEEMDLDLTRSFAAKLGFLALQILDEADAIGRSIAAEWLS